MPKILLCGSMAPRAFETRLKYLSAAGNQYQSNLFNALQSVGPTHTLNHISIPTEIPYSELQQEGNTGENRIVWGRKHRLSSFLRFRKLLQSEIEWADVIITYNVVYAWFGLPALCKQKGKKSVLVLADYTPPEEERSLIHKILSVIAQKEISHYDKVVLLSSGSIHYLDDAQERTIINGCVDFDRFLNITPPCKKEHTVFVYTGFLSRVTGVDLLIDAFLQIENPDYRLIISGQGQELDSDIKHAVEKDPRIIYKGFLPWNEYYELLQYANVLVNPRNMNFLQNSYNFPSKVLEYLAAGRPTVSTKFQGYSDYQEYLVFVDSDANSIKRGLIEAAEVDGEKTYIRNREFAQAQTWQRKVEEFL